MINLSLYWNKNCPYKINKNTNKKLQFNNVTNRTHCAPKLIKTKKNEKPSNICACSTCVQKPCIFSSQYNNNTISKAQNLAKIVNARNNHRLSCVPTFLKSRYQTVNHEIVHNGSFIQSGVNNFGRLTKNSGNINNPLQGGLVISNYS